MNIVVCVKQVPDTAHLKFDGQNQLDRAGIENVMNPFDEYAVETAIRLKEAHEGSKLTALCIGPAGAKDVLKRCVAMGCDDGIHLLDDAFSDADGWASAYTLSAAIKKSCADFDLILLGQFATDSMSGVTGPALAEFLGIPSINFIKSAELKGDKVLNVSRKSERGLESYELSLPGLVCVQKCDYEARIPSIKGVMKANRTEIPTMTLADLGLSADQVGKAGSPTVVQESWRKPKKEGGVKVDGSDPQVAVNQLIGFLKEQKIM